MRTWQKSMQEAGFVHYGSFVGMYYSPDKHGLNNYTIPEALNIKQCTIDKDFADFGAAYASTFDPSNNQVEAFY